MPELTYEQKAAILNSNGWQTLWNDDYWIKKEWLQDPRMNIDWAGLSTDQALEQVMSKLEMKELI